MRRLRPARFLAPIALIAAVLVTYFVVHDSLKSKPSKTTTAVTTATTTRSSTVPGKPAPHHGPGNVYVVKPGDSLSVISAKTGIPVATLEALNPRADPNALQTGERLTLRK